MCNDTVLSSCLFTERGPTHLDVVVVANDHADTARRVGRRCRQVDGRVHNGVRVVKAMSHLQYVKEQGRKACRKQRPMPDVLNMPAVRRGPATCRLPLRQPEEYDSIAILGAPYATRKYRLVPEAGCAQMSRSLWCLDFQRGLGLPQTPPLPSTLRKNNVGYLLGQRRVCAGKA